MVRNPWWCVWFEKRERLFCLLVYSEREEANCGWKRMLLRMLAEIVVAELIGGDGWFEWVGVL